jgi:phage FluMu protein Com
MYLMEDIRCGTCDKLLARGAVIDINIKCPRCKTINNIQCKRSRSSSPSGRQKPSCTCHTQENTRDSAP